MFTKSGSSSAQPEGLAIGKREEAAGIKSQKARYRRHFCSVALLNPKSQSEPQEPPQRQEYGDKNDEKVTPAKRIDCAISDDDIAEYQQGEAGCVADNAGQMSTSDRVVQFTGRFRY